MKKNAVILQKPSGTIAVRVDITAEQRRLYNGLLWVAREIIKKNKDERHYSIKLAELKKLLNKSEQNKHNDYYKDKMKELMQKIAEYNILSKDKRMSGAFVLVSHILFEEDKETKETVVKFEIPEFVRERLVNPQDSLYANINLVVIRGLTSKYAIILYELVRDYQRSEIPVMEMKKFKEVFGIDKVNSYNRMNNLKAKVLDKAVEELNNNENIDFTVSYKLIRQGKAYKYIKFEIKPKLKQKMLEEKRDNMHLKVLIDAVPEQERSKQLENYLATCLKSYDAKYLLHQIKYVAEQKPKNFLAYLRKSIDEDFANIELAEEQEKAEQERIERLVQQELEKLEAEKLSLIDMAVDREKDRIYEEYVSLLENNEKQELFNEYRAKTKELYQDVKEGSFLFEETMKRLITEHIISKNEIYQKRLEKIRKDAEEKAERAYQREKETLREKIENGYIRLPLTI
jgi:plasmid replication initiation protein